MCGCDLSFVCPQRVGTPFDPAYLDNELPALTADDFDRLANAPEWAVRP